MTVIKPFTEKYLAEAVQLFVANYKLLRQESPLIPEKYEDPQTIMPLITDLVKESGGVVALQDNLLVGYMLNGFRIPYFKGTSYGAYCPEWGHAAIDTAKAAIYHQMYRQLSRQWVAQGCFTQAFTLLAHGKELLDAFFWYGFGLLTIDAIRSLEPVSVETPATVTIRPAALDDITMLVQLETELQKYLASAPIFLSQGEPVKPDELKRALAEKTKKVWLALAADQPVAYMQAEASAFGAAQIVNDTDTTSITGAFTQPEYRGQGVAAALLGQLLADAAGRGCKRCSVDFETANLAGRRFWLAHFQPVCYSVIRHIDENIIWANGRFNIY